MSILIKKS